MGRDSKLLANDANEQSFPLMCEQDKPRLLHCQPWGLPPSPPYQKTPGRKSYHQEPKHPVPGKYNQTSWIFDWIWLNCLSGKQIPPSYIPWNPLCLSWVVHMKTGVNGALGKFTLCVWFYDRRFCMFDACSQGYPQVEALVFLQINVASWWQRTMPCLSIDYPTPVLSFKTLDGSINYFLHCYGNSRQKQGKEGGFPVAHSLRLQWYIVIKEAEGTWCGWHPQSESWERGVLMLSSGPQPTGYHCLHLGWVFPRQLA